MAAKKSVAKPTVKRGEDGKIVSLKQKPGPTSGLPEFVGKTKDPKAVASRPVKPRKKTRTDKVIDSKTGKVFVPKVARGENGKIRATTPEEQVAAKTTVLPAVEPKAEPKKDAPMAIRGARSVSKGFAVAYPVVEKAVHAAMTHIGNMRATHGTDEFHQHHEAFNLIHANIGKMSPELHTSLGQARHEVMNPSDKTDGNLALIHKAVSARLAIGRAAHNERQARSGAGEQE